MNDDLRTELRDAVDHDIDDFWSPDSRKSPYAILTKWALRVQEAEEQRADFHEASLILKHALNAARREAEYRQNWWRGLCSPPLLPWSPEGAGFDGAKVDTAGMTPTAEGAGLQPDATPPTRDEFAALAAKVDAVRDLAVALADHALEQAETNALIVRSPALDGIRALAERVRTARTGEEEADRG